MKHVFGTPELLGKAGEASEPGTPFIIIKKGLSGEDLSGGSPGSCLCALLEFYRQGPHFLETFPRLLSRKGLVELALLCRMVWVFVVTARDS